MKDIIGTCSVLVVLLLLVASAPALAQSSTKNTQVSKSVPEHVVYEFYFRRISSFEDMAQKNDKDGLNVNRAHALIQKELGIDDAQRYILNQIAAASLAKVAALDAKAAAIIQRARSRYPGGRLPSPNIVPETPPELAELQAARNAIFTDAKAQLSSSLEAATFQYLDTCIKSIILPKVEIKKPEPAK
jgi:hypothetical protein